VSADYEALPPLAVALAGPALVPEDQARVRRASLSDVALTVPPGAERAARWLALADAVAAGRGQLGRKPSRLAADLDRAAKGTTVGELLGTVTGVSVGYGFDGPVAVAHLDGSPAAGRWTQELPRLLPEILGPSAGVSSEATAAGRVFALQWGDEAARSRLSLGVTPHALYAAADPGTVAQLLKPRAAAALPKSRGVVQVPIALFRLGLAPPPPATQAVAPAEGGVFLVPGGPGRQAVLVEDGPSSTPPPAQSSSDGFDLLVRRLRPLPLLSVDAAVATASPNRVTVTARLTDAKATLRRLFEMPKPAAPAEPPAKDAEEPVAPTRP